MSMVDISADHLAISTEKKATQFLGCGPLFRKRAYCCPLRYHLAKMVVGMRLSSNAAEESQVYRVDLKSQAYRIQVAKFEMERRVLLSS